MICYKLMVLYWVRILTKKSSCHGAGKANGLFALNLSVCCVVLKTLKVGGYHKL